MKKLIALGLLALGGVVLVSGGEPAKRPAPAPVASLLVTAAKVTAPFEVNNGVLAQPEVTELTDGGKAVWEFSVPVAGDYVLRAVVDAPSDEANSFFLNIDASPRDPEMIWDIDVTVGFETRVVSWRGRGEADSDEFKPKRFTLAAGAHRLFLVGREPTRIKSLFVYAAE